MSATPFFDRDRQLLIADTVIQHLAADEADLRAYVKELEADLITYRELAQHAIHCLAEVTRDRDWQSADRIVVLTENRRLREQLRQCQAGPDA